MTGWLSAVAMFDFVHWAIHVLGASVSVGNGPYIMVYLAKVPPSSKPRANIVFELHTGRVYTDYPAVMWLDAEDPKQWRDVLAGDDSVAQKLAKAYPCGKLQCCLFRPE